MGGKILQLTLDFCGTYADLRDLRALLSSKLLQSEWKGRVLPMISVLLPDVAARWGTPSNKFANTFVRLSDFVMWWSWFKKTQAHVRCRCKWKLRGWAKIRCRLILGFERSVGVHSAMPCPAPSWMSKFNQYAPKKIHPQNYVRVRRKSPIQKLCKCFG